MVQAPKFNENCKEYEPISKINTALIQQLEKEENENGGQSIFSSKIVYDSLDPSPFYSEKDGDTYLDELLFVDMGLTDEEKQNLPA